MFIAFTLGLGDIDILYSEINITSLGNALIIHLSLNLLGIIPLTSLRIVLCSKRASCKHRFNELNIVLPYVFICGRLCPFGTTLLKHL
jgi:hypothetical protein